MVQMSRAVTGIYARAATGSEGDEAAMASAGRAQRRARLAHMIVIECAECGSRIDGDGPAVLRLNDAIWWEPFVDDIRSSAKFEFHHPRCFADRFGVDGLIAAVRREDMRRTGRLDS